MKTATIPSLRVEPELREAAESLLAEGETLSAFIEQSVRAEVQRRRLTQEFVARGLQGREDAASGAGYVDADVMVGRLASRLKSAKRASPR